jgi:hypothetical protein
MDSIFERRQENRNHFSKPIELTWTDRNGERRRAAGTTVNVSLYGVLLEIPQAIPLLTEVSVSIQGTSLSSKARVRHCQAASWFRVGLQFDRTLLAEHIASLDTALIQSLRCADYNSESVNMPRLRCWRQFLHGVARLMHLEPNRVHRSNMPSANLAPAVFN